MKAAILASARSRRAAASSTMSRRRAATPTRDRCFATVESMPIAGKATSPSLRALPLLTRAGGRASRHYNVTTTLPADIDRFIDADVCRPEPLARVGDQRQCHVGMTMTATEFDLIIRPRCDFQRQRVTVSPNSPDIDRRDAAFRDIVHGGRASVQDDSPALQAFSTLHAEVIANDRPARRREVHTQQPFVAASSSPDHDGRL